MAGALYKKEVVIRPSSTISVQGGKNWTKNWLNGFQNNASNEDQYGNYIDYFFGDLFDSRTGNIYRIFSDACTSKYSLTTLEFDIVDLSKLIPKTDINDNPDLSVDPLKIMTRQGIDSVIEDFILESRIVNDAAIMNNDRITLGATPSGGIIGGKCMVKISNGVFDEVDCTVSGNTLIAQPDIAGQYDGKIVLASYLVND